MEFLTQLPAHLPFTRIVSQLKERKGVPLAPQSPWDETIKQELDHLTPEELLGGEIQDQSFGKAVKSGLYNWNDCLEEAHILAQQIETPTGSYWHGIMHRREPDYSNSKYWFRQVGQHPIFPQVYKAVVDFLQSRASTSDYARGWLESLKSGGRWDPFDFIDRCASTGDRDFPSSDRTLLEQITNLEIQILLDYSYQCALKGGG